MLKDDKKNHEYATKFSHEKFTQRFYPFNTGESTIAYTQSAFQTHVRRLGSTGKANATVGNYENMRTARSAACIATNAAPRIPTNAVRTTREEILCPI
jgi:hypothetical protein